MSRTTSRTTRGALAAGTTAALLLAGAATLASPAEAKGDDDNRVIRTGSCSGSADWKLKAKDEDGRIEIEFEVDSNRVGQVWRVGLRRNGTLVLGGTRTTRGPSGSFTVRKVISNAPGDDVIVGRATHGSQVCRGQVTYRG